MNTLHVAAPVSSPSLELPAARPAPAPRARENTSGVQVSPNGPESAVLPEKSSDDPVALRAAVDEVASELKSISSHSLEISFEEEDSRYVVQVLDSESGEVLRQIPPETLLEANRQLSNLRGLLFDDRS